MAARFTLLADTHTHTQPKKKTPLHFCCWQWNLLLPTKPKRDETDKRNDEELFASSLFFSLIYVTLRFYIVKLRNNFTSNRQYAKQNPSDKLNEHLFCLYFTFPLRKSTVKKGLFHSDWINIFAIIWISLDDSWCRSFFIMRIWIA